MAANLEQYALQMASAASQYLISSTADYRAERWLQFINERTHSELSPLIRDLCNFDFNRRLTDGESVLRRLDICAF